MNTLKVSLLLCVLSCFNLISKAQTSNRHKESINSNWKFKKVNAIDVSKDSFNDSLWEDVNLPHTWNSQDVNDETKGYYMGVGWYRKIISLPFNQKNKKTYIYFEGANQVTDVYVNGNFVGNHKGGYTAFSFDITRYLKSNAENSIAVKVDNSINLSIPPLSADFTFFGGIYRDVYLITSNEIHFDLNNYASSGVFIETPLVNAKQAEVKIRGKVVNESARGDNLKIVSNILDASGKTVGSVSKVLKIKSKGSSDFDQMVKLIDINLWSPEDPYLYKVETTIRNAKTNEVIDYVSNPLGLRFFHFDANKGFFLNGKKYKLIGANRHQDYKGMGNALPDELHYQDMKLLKEMGANFIRIAHYPQDPAVLNACDRLGIIAWEEIPLVDGVADNDGFAENSISMLKSMIRQHYNHPSIMIWGYMNEILLKIPYKKDEAEKLEKYKSFVLNLAKNLDKSARAEDPGRYTAMAFHGSFDVYHQLGLTKIPQIVGWNLYQGWYGGNLSQFTTFLEKAHKELPDKPTIISEYGAGSDTRIHATQPRRFDFSIEYQIIYNQSYLEQIYAKDYVAGAVAWNFVDFNSEGRKDTNPNINNKGLVTDDRKPKDVYYLYKALLRTEPVMKIASESYKNRSGLAKSATEKYCVQQVQVFSNQPQVELFHNGKSLGIKSIIKNEAFWDVPFVNGSNLLEAKAGTKSQKDFINIDFDLQPAKLSDQSFRSININCGAHFSFFDDQAKETWLPDQPYKEGSYGYLGARILTTWAGIKIGTDKAIASSALEPLYQTQLDSVQSYKIDVAPGDYKVTFYYADVTETASDEKLVYNLGATGTSITSGKNVFDVYVNGNLVEKDFDINKYGNAVAVKREFTIHMKDEKGLNIFFKASKGNAFLNALSVKKAN